MTMINIDEVEYTTETTLTIRESRRRTTVPKEIVDVFEKYGFIWGGRWYHYDTMHFEYRPELFDTVD